MQDSTLLLVAGAGLALVCVGLVVVGLLALLRVIGVGSIPLLGALLGGGDDDSSRPVRTSPKPNLRSIAQGASSDFDAALAQHDAQTQSAPQTTNVASFTAPPPANPAATPAPFADAPPRLGSRRANTRPRPNNDDEDDDMLGGVLDEEL
jgi:hypothetical protein